MNATSTSPKNDSADVVASVKGERKKHRFGLSGRLMLGILAAGAVPIAIGLLVAYMTGTNQLQQVIGDSFAALAQSSASKIDREMQRLIAADSLIAQLAAADSELREVLLRRESRTVTNGAMSRIEWRPPAGKGYNDDALLQTWITRPDGGVVDAAVPKNAAPVAISGLRFDADAQRYLLHVSAPLVDAQANVLGWMHRDYDAKILLDPLVFPIRFGRTGHVMIIDNHGVIVSCPDLLTGSRIEDPELIDRIATDQIRWIISASDGHGSRRTSLVGHAPLLWTNSMLESEMSWYMFVWQDSREIFAPAASLMRGVGQGGIVALGLLGFLGLYTSKRIVRPIQKLRTEVAHIRAGDLERNLDIHTGDEIEELAEEFDDMRVQLRELVRNLEQAVTERTRELESTEAEKNMVVERLIQAEKLATIATMASGVAHEINNPLYAIFGMAEAMQDAQDIAEYRRYAGDIIKQCKQISETIKNLSGYVRPGSEHEIVQVDINKQLSNAISLIKRSPMADQFEVRETLAEVPEILAKPEEIQQVCFNIIRNGLQAMNEKGVIEISTHSDGARVWMKICDHGTGIPKELMGKVFDPFFTTKGPHEGDGLGLFIVGQIIKKYDGKVRINSQEGIGTTFSIFFPAADQHRMGA